MRLTTRIATLERQKSGNPALVQQWVAMLTRLYASIAKSDAAQRDDQGLSPPVPINPDGIRQEAERYAARGSPATIGDLFRLVREAEGED